MRLQESNESSDLVNFWICGDPLTRATISCACEAGHEWVVYSTALEEGWLMLQCVECGLMGTIENPSKEEWSQAFHASSRPYPWSDEGRVVHKQIASFRVIRAIESPECPCPRHSLLPENMAMSEFLVAFGSTTRRSADDVRAELIDLADFVGGSELCSHLLPLFIRSFEADTGQRHSEAMHLIVNRIEKFDLKGLHCSPAVVAKIIRDFAEYHVP